MALKFAMLTVAYLAKAGGLPHEFAKVLEDALITTQSRLASGSGAGARDTGSARESLSHYESAGAKPGKVTESSPPVPRQTVLPDVIESEETPRRET
jgi:hypothetical protein